MVGHKDGSSDKPHLKLAIIYSYVYADKADMTQCVTIRYEKITQKFNETLRVFGVTTHSIFKETKCKTF